MHLGGVGPRAHVGENHHSSVGKTIQSWRLPFNAPSPIRRLAPGISWRGAPVNISDAPERFLFFFLKKKCGDGHATLRTSLLACGRLLRASFGARSGKSAERRRLHGVRAAAQRRSASVCVCADYRLPPRDPPINRQRIRQRRAGASVIPHWEAAAPTVEPRR